MPSIGDIFAVFIAVFIVVDPIGIIPVYISLTAGMAREKRKSTILRAGLVAFIVLCLFVFTGNAILSFIGIQPGSFSIAGGALLFIVSIDLLFGKPGRTKTSTDGGERERDDVSIFPLAIPMLAGPGTITTILLYVSEGPNAVMYPILVGSIALALLCAGLAMFLSGYFLRALGKTGVSVVERIMGIILAGLSVQFIYDGLLKLKIFSL
jgi:multiple antibiotic resistance protein